MKEIIKESIVVKDKGTWWWDWRYYIDYKGSLVRKKEYVFWNMWTLFTILLVIAAYSYLNDTKACRITLSHLDRTCDVYADTKVKYYQEHNETNATEIIKITIANLTNG